MQSPRLVCAVLMVPLTLLLAGCGLIRKSEGEAHVPLNLEVLIDVSGSYDVLPAAIETVQDYVLDLSPGDAMVIRTLSQLSHRGRGVLVRLEMERARGKSSRLDLMAQAGQHSVGLKQDSAKAAAVGLLHSLLAEKRAGRTDIIGGVVVAGESLRFSITEQARAILILTDGKDNGPNKGLGIPLDLDGIHVVFLHFDPSGSLAERSALRKEWEHRTLADWSATAVTFIPPEESVSLDRLRKLIARERAL